MFWIFIIRYFLIVNLIVHVFGANYSYSWIRKTFEARFLTLIGNGSHVSEIKLRDVMLGNSWEWTKESRLPECLTTQTTVLGITEEKCLLSQCLSPTDIYNLCGLENNSTETELSTLAWILFHLSQNASCRTGNFKHEVEVYDKPPTMLEIWGFGLLCTTVIVLCAMGCLVALPFVHGVNYKKTLIFMVGLAVGTLAGSSLLFLLPEALQLEDDVLDSHSYVWKCLVMIAAIYAFFLLEKFLKMLTERKERKREQKLRQELEASRYARRKSRRESEIRDICLSLRGSKDLGHTNPLEAIKEGDNEKLPDIPEEEGDNHVAPVAWMILLGDGVHNFIDGVSLGAAFTESVSAGVSVSVAIICEELPHELGDFAVLLTAGMSKKRAVLFNVLSACTIYAGLVVGIFLGENTETHTWVFAFAAGMFIYIALVDMMPELIVAAESEQNRTLIGSGTIFLLQNLGILLGFGAILLLAIFGGRMETAIKGH